MFPKSVENEIKLFVVFVSKVVDFSLQKSILQLGNFVEFPPHRHVTQVYDAPKWMPEGLFADQHMVHHKNNHRQIFCVRMSFEDFWMLLVDRTTNWISFTHDCIHNQFLRYK